MQASDALNLIQEYLLQDKQGFEVERNKSFQQLTVPLYARRKAGLGGLDFLFIHNADNLSSDVAMLKTLHEEARKVANGFFKMPKAFRFKIPNIVSLFVKTGGLTKEMIAWAQEPTRSMVGGEFHSVFMLDVQSPGFYVQGISHTPIMGSGVVIPHEEFKTIDPQNRGHYLVAGIFRVLFG